MSIKQQSCVEALKRIVAAVEAIPEDVEGWMPDALTDALIDASQAIAVYESTPPECQTEAEKTAYAFGWWKAMESQRAEKQTSVSEVEPVAFKDKDGNVVMTIDASAPLVMVPHPAFQKHTWVNATTWRGLTDEEIEDCYKQGGIGRAIQMLKEKNT